ncbi:MAG: hypothetical protein JOZ05_19045 [Acetobacteraceae bacterium]|nr:hypothetical protein [Acetobacteraceae bacterium]
MSIEPEQPGGPIDPSYDDGLAHSHNWARERMADQGMVLLVADAASVATPSSVLHDDAHYAVT